MVNEADRDRDGAISEQELVDFLAPPEGPPPQPALQAQAAARR